MNISSRLFRLQSRTRLLCLFLCMGFFFSAPSLHAASAPKKAKTALVLAYFGSTMAAEQNPIAQITETVQAQNPHSPVFVAYTSSHVARVLAKRGQQAPMLAEVLATLSAQGFTHVAVQSLHITPGLEFDNTAETARRFAGLPKGIVQVSMGAPLIGEETDVAPVANLLLASLPANRPASQPTKLAAKLAANEAALFVGHGAVGAGGLAYPALQAALWAQTPRAFVGTIEGAPSSSPKAIIAALQEQKITTVWLTPLLGIVGDHARNDVFGEEAESWASQLRAAGFTVKENPVGLYTLPGVATQFAAHAAAALERLEQ